MLSQTAEYALRAIVWLAQHGDSTQTTPEISQGMQVPEPYLAKVLQCLVRHGLVRGQRGKGGGFALARSAAELTVLDVVTAVDPIRRINSCPLKLEQHRTALCPLHRKLDQAACLLEDAFRAATIASLLEPQVAPALLVLPEAAHAC